MDCDSKFIRSFDHFGYGPQFRINGDSVYKSFTGGLIFLFFLIFAIYYFYTSANRFINNIDIVNTSRQSIKIANNYYNLTTLDIYMGIGLIDTKKQEINYIEMFSFLEFSFIFNNKNQMNNYSNQEIPLGKCNLSLLVHDYDYNQMNASEISNLNKKFDYYLCPDYSNYTLYLQPDSFDKNNAYFTMTVSLKKNLNISDFASFRKNISKNRPRLNLIYKQLAMNIDSKNSPYKIYVENIYNSIDFEYSKRTEMRIDPLELMDNANIFSAGFKYFNNKSITSQQNGTVFQIFRKGDNFETNDDVLDPYRYFVKFIFRVGTTTQVIWRSYDKLSNFLAETGAILTNLLMVFAIVMSKVNQINGKNLLLESMFSYDAIKNIIKFNEDVKLLVKNINSDELKKYPLDNNIEEKNDSLDFNQNLKVNQEQKPMDFSTELLVRNPPNKENSKFVKKYLI